MTFFATMVSTGSVYWKGAFFEVFTTLESPTSLAVGDRVRCLFVPETQQVFVLEVIA